MEVALYYNNSVYYSIGAEYSHFRVDVDITNNIILCVLESYLAEYNFSCIIQAIFKLKRENCSIYQMESPNYAYEISSKVNVDHLPRNQIFCFVAEAKNLTSTMILTGSFSTSTGCNHMPVLNFSYLALFAAGAIHDLAQQTTVILSTLAVLMAVLTVVVSVIVVYIILKKKQARKSIVVM